MRNKLENEENVNIDYESLIDNLKNRDTENIHKNRRIIILGLFFLIIYFIKMIMDNNISSSELFFTVFIFVGYMFFVIYRVFYLRMFKKVNYFDSVKKLILSAEKRYKFWNGKMIYESIGAIIVLLFFAYFMYNKHYMDWSQIKLILVSILLPIAVGIFSFLRSYFIWKKEDRILWLSTKSMLKELEE